MKNNIVKNWHKYIYYYLIVLLFYIPFQFLISKILEAHTVLGAGAIFWLLHWYEPMALVLFVLSLIKMIFRKDYSSVSVLILATIFLGLISVFFISPSIGRGLEGFRFTLFPLVVLFIAGNAGLDRNKIARLIRSYSILALIIALWALFERLLPAHYWEKWHLLSAGSKFGYGNFFIPGLYQSASLLGAPNQLASYLLPALMIFLVGRSYERKISLLAVFVIGLAILLTLSRSAILGLLVGVFIYGWIRAKNKIVPVIVLTVLVGVTVLVFLSSKNQESRLIYDLVTHGASGSQHWQAMSHSLAEIANRISKPFVLLFGSGLGLAGPLALKYGNGFVSESWYLQLALEIGLVGLLLWSGLATLILRRLLAEKEIGLSLGLISMLTAALFLHTFADNPAGAITLFILIGNAGNSKL